MPIHLSLGPFQGITDRIYRNTIMELFGGIDKLYTPFFTGIHKDNSRSLRSDEIDPDCNDVASLTPQILSNDATEMIRFADQCGGFGYREINLNLGCPYPRVAKKKRGSGLLPHHEQVDEILAQYFAHSNMRLSIKCRLGYESPEDIHELTKVFNRYPISELIVHARLGRQLYKGAVLEEEFRQLIPQINTTLWYNGDVFSAADARRFESLFQPVDHFMLGRGLLADPFLALDIKGISSPTTDRKKAVHDFTEQLYLARREASNSNPRVIGRMKELWSYLMWSFETPQPIWRLIRKTNSFEAYESAVEQVFDQHHWVGAGFGRANGFSQESLVNEEI